MSTAVEIRQSSEPFVAYVGSTAPPYSERITIDKRDQDMTLADSVALNIRPLTSRTPSLVGSGFGTKPLENGDNVVYQWCNEDLDDPGEFMAWWTFSIEGVDYETSERRLIVSDHGPGLGTPTGAIVDGAGTYMPVTHAALMGDANFGSRRMQYVATLIQQRVVGSHVSPDAEQATYQLQLLDYLSKRLALELCAPGIDYWSRQHKTVTTQGPTEIASYPDMIASLDKLQARLSEELVQDWRDLQLLLPAVPQRNVMVLPASSLENERTITRNPYTVQPLLTGLRLGVWPFA